MNDKIKAWVGLISSMITQKNISLGSEVLAKTAVRNDIQHALVSVGGEGLDSFKKNDDRKIKLDTPLYKFMSLYARYLDMANNQNWGMVCDHLVKSKDYEDAWDIVWNKAKGVVKEHLEEDKQSGYAVILNVQTFKNISEGSVPSWRTGQDTRVLVKRGISKQEANDIAESIITGKLVLAMKETTSIREAIIGIDVITNKAYSTIEEEDTTNDVFFQNIVQKSGKEKPIDESFMDYVLSLRTRSGIKETSYKSTVPSIHDLKNMLYPEVKKSAVLKDSQLSEAFLYTTSALRLNPLSEASRVVRAVANKLYNTESVSEEIAEYVEKQTGMNLHKFSSFVKNNIQETYSKEAHQWVEKRVDELYPKHIKDKSEAFGRAWNEWEENHS